MKTYQYINAQEAVKDRTQYRASKERVIRDTRNTLHPLYGLATFVTLADNTLVIYLEKTRDYYIEARVSGGEMLFIRVIDGERVIEAKGADMAQLDCYGQIVTLWQVAIGKGMV